MDFSSAHPDGRIWQTPNADTPINTIPQPPGVSPKIQVRNTQPKYKPSVAHNSSAELRQNRPSKPATGPTTAPSAARSAHKSRFGSKSDRQAGQSVNFDGCAEDLPDCFHPRFYFS
jgi:hypothetical protein